MSRTRLAIPAMLFACATTQVFGCSSDNGNPNASQIQAACEKYGDLSVALSCPGLTTRQAVVDQCVQEAAAAPQKCKSQLDAADACAVKQPTSSFQCRSDQNDGTTELKDGICPNESAALISCLLGG